MAFTGLNYLAVLAAAVAGFVFGGLWYTVLGKAWMAALGMVERPAPKPGIFVLTFSCQLFMAWMLAGLIGHAGAPSSGRDSLRPPCWSTIASRGRAGNSR